MSGLRLANVNPEADDAVDEEEQMDDANAEDVREPMMEQGVEAVNGDAIEEDDEPQHEQFDAAVADDNFAAPIACAGGQQEHSALVQTLMTELERRFGPGPAARNDIPVGVKEWAHAWTEPADFAFAARNPCPIEPCSLPSPELARFTEYLKDMNLADATINSYLAALGRLFGMVNCEWTDQTNAIDILVSMYKQNVVTQLFRLPIMDPRHSWGLKMAIALGHYCTHLATQCFKQSLPAEKGYIEQIEVETLSNYKRRCKAARAARDALKNRMDAELLDNFASVDELKAAVHNAMLDLKMLSEIGQSTGGLSETLKHSANAAIVFIVFVNGFAGRSREWESLSASHLRKVLLAGQAFIACSTHKTAKYYGDVGKGIAPGTARALLVYLSLPRKLTDHFLEPSRAGTRSTVAACLRTASALYLPGRPPAKVNLLRKLFHTAYLHISRTDDVLGFLARADKHSKAVARKYCCETAEKDAELGLMLYKGIFGSPVGWPDAEASQSDNLFNRLESVDAAVLANADCNGEASEEEGVLEAVEASFAHSVASVGSADGTADCGEVAVPACSLDLAQERYVTSWYGNDHGWYDDNAETRMEVMPNNQWFQTVLASGMEDGYFPRVGGPTLKDLQMFVRDELLD